MKSQFMPLTVLTAALLFMQCSKETPPLPEIPEEPTPVSEYILAIDIVNKDLSAVKFDNEQRVIEVSLPRITSKNVVRIRLTLNKGVEMEYPATAEADYDLTKSNTGVWLKSGGETIRFTVRLKEYPLPESAVGKATIRDMVLIYDSYWAHRPDWDERMFEPYVSVASADGSHQWLFDGFLFIEFTDGVYQFCHGYSRANARKTEWIKLVNHQLFSEGLSMQALDRYIEKIKPSAPNYDKHKAVMTLPEPIQSQQDWGELDGKALHFAYDADRIAACKWYVDHTISEYKAAGLKNLQLAGFYWVSEAVGESQAVVKAIADYIHSKNLNFYWIPYFLASGYSQWASFGFDEAWLQPNYFFSTTIPPSRLDEACELANRYSMSNEFEFDREALWGGGKRQRMIDYIDAFTRNNVFQDKNISYYEGGDGLYGLRYGVEPDRALYKQLTDIIIERQKRFYEKNNEQ